jgi:hypothetical protein
LQASLRTLFLYLFISLPSARADRPTDGLRPRGLVIPLDTAFGDDLQKFLANPDLKGLDADASRRTSVHMPTVIEPKAGWQSVSAACKREVGGLCRRLSPSRVPAMPAGAMVAFMNLI